MYSDGAPDKVTKRILALGGKDGNLPNMAPTGTLNQTLALTAPTILSTSPKFAQLLNLIGKEVTSDIKALQNRTTLQYAALEWLANVDAWEVDMDSVPSQVFVERYVLALLYLSTNRRLWINRFKFLFPTSVCEWTSGGIGVACNEDELVVALSLSKSKHEEVARVVFFVCMSR